MIPPNGEHDAEVADPPASADAPRGPLGSGTFTLEGRAAPGLFALAWLGTLVGGVVLFVSLQAGDGPAKLVLFVVGLTLLSIGLVAGAGSQAIERRARGVAAYQGPSPLLVFAAIVPIVLLFGTLLAVPLSLVGIDLDTPVVLVIGSAVQLLVYIGILRIVVVDTGSLSWREMGVVRPTAASVRELFVGALWAPPIVFLTALLGFVLIQLFGVEPSGPLAPAGEPVGFVANVIVAVLFAPIGEELFFRGFATTAWSRAVGPTMAIVRGGVFFAFVHIVTVTVGSAAEALPVALIAFLSRIPIGLVLGWLFLRRANIWAPLGLHAAFNAILIILAEAALQTPAG